MARPLRLEFPGSLFHITQRGNERRPMFHSDRDRVHFLDLLASAIRRFNWLVSAYALMLNHYHLLLEVTDENTLSRGMQWLDGKYASWFNRQYARAGHLVQGRFHGILVDSETYFLELVRYVVLNPVRAGLVRRPEDYRWTSYRSTAGLVKPPSWLAVDRILQRFGPIDLAAARYRAFVDEGIGSPVRPWDQLVGDMYLGSDDWLARVRERVESEPRDTAHARNQRHLLRPSMTDIISATAAEMHVTEERIRTHRTGLPRTIAAWLGCYEGMLTNREIAAALRLRSDSRVTRLVAECDEELSGNQVLQNLIDRCVATLRRKKCEMKL
jgi:putative transposase